MARRPRIQIPGALQHVYNRGNYRSPIFETPNAARAFEACLFEACERFELLLRAYALMLNHFHLLLETPRANLIKAMHWLDSTFATRFNRFRNERGHVFQGRYGCVLVEPGRHLLRTVNYIHLNPVKAKVVTAAELPGYRWSSYWHFRRPDRPKFLVCDDWLAELDGLHDTPEGWRSYQDYLVMVSENDAEQKSQAFDRMCKGWAFGTEEWRKEIIREHADQFVDIPLFGTELKELREGQALLALEKLLAAAGKTRADARRESRNVEWKLKIAAELRRTTEATNAWIGRELHMGAPSTVSTYLSRRGIK